MNLLDLYENREPYQQAIDKLEQRRIEDLEAKMDDCARRGDKEGFQKCKAERDSYHRVKMDEGSMKQWLWNEAERMDRDAFVANADEYGMSAEEAAKWWDDINGVEEAGIGQDIVNKTEKMARATPPTTAGKVASTVKNAAKWLAGKGGPGKEGPTYEQEELDEKLKGLPTKKLGSARDLGKSVRKFQAQRGLEEAGTDGQWSKESDWKEIPKTKSGRPVDPRGEVTHLSDVARREAERKAAQKKNPEKVAEEGSRPRDLAAAVMLKKARAAFPIAGNDAEALALYIADKEQRDVNRLERENDEEDALIARIMDQLKKTEVSEGDVNPKFIIAQVTRLLATEARRMTNAPMAQLLAPVMKEYGLSLQQIDAMVPGGLRKAAGEYGIMMKESSWGGSGPAGLKTPYAVYTKQNGQVKRVKTTNKIGQPMNTREAEAYVAAMRKSDPARWTHDTVWVAPADIDLDEAVNEKGALKAAQQAAEFIITNLDDRAALKDYSLHFWSPAKFYQGATRAMRGAGVDEIAKHIIQDRPAEFPKNQNEAANPAQQAAIAIAMKRAGKVKEQGVYIGKSLTSVKILEYIKTVLENFIRTKGFKGGPSLVNELRPLLDQLDQVNEKDLAMNIREMMQAAERNDRSTRGLSWGMFAQELSKKIPELIRKRTTQGVTEAIPVIRGTQSTGAQYANQLAKIAMKLAKQRHADGLRADAKDFNKAAKLFAAGDVDGGAEIIAYEMDTEPADEFYAYMEHYKIPTEIVFGLNEETTRLDPKCWTGKKIGNPKTKVKGGVRVNNCVPAEESYTGVMESQGITDPKFLEVARRIDAFAKTIK